MRRALTALGFLFGLYLVARAIVEPFAIDMTDPATYADDWGGPSLLGVLAVHCVPGLIAGAAIVWVLIRRRASPPERMAPSDRPAGRR